jgi:urate oxidase
MGMKLVENAYGKNAVHLSKIIRHDGYHEFRQVSVNVVLEGDFESAHVDGDNSRILPTDTQKNTVYALAKDHFVSTIENFGLYLANHFISNNPQLTRVKIEMSEHIYSRLSFDGQPHPHAFTGGNSEKHTAVVVQDVASSVTVTSGIKDLLVLKTRDSGFEHFIKDEFTTLKETSDRILATSFEADWLYNLVDIDFISQYDRIRETLLRNFSFHKSLSLQHTLYTMGKAVLEENPFIRQISFKMPNQHHIPFNLAQFGMENNNEVFVATESPYGYITGTLRRE